MIIVLLSFSSLVYSSANLFVVLFVVGYNELPLVGYRLSLYILLIIGTNFPNSHTLHYYCLCCFFRVSRWSINQLSFLSCCASIHPFPAQKPSGRVLCCAFVEAMAIVCASPLPILGMCVLFLLLG